LLKNQSIFGIWISQGISIHEQTISTQIKFSLFVHNIEKKSYLVSV